MRFHEYIYQRISGSNFSEGGGIRSLEHGLARMALVFFIEFLDGYKGSDPLGKGILAY